MRDIRITRVNPKTGLTETPHLHPGGTYALGDPAYAEDKKKAEFEIRVGSLEDVLRLLKRGFHVRMHDGVRKVRPSLISPRRLEVRIDGVRI